jgi:hypothetical protein
VRSDAEQKAVATFSRRSAGAKKQVNWDEF